MLCVCVLCVSVCCVCCVCLCVVHVVCVCVCVLCVSVLCMLCVCTCGVCACMCVLCVCVCTCGVCVVCVVCVYMCVVCVCCMYVCGVCVVCVHVCVVCVCVCVVHVVYVCVCVCVCVPQQTIHNLPLGGGHREGTVQMQNERTGSSEFRLYLNPCKPTSVHRWLLSALVCTPMDVVCTCVYTNGCCLHLYIHPSSIFSQLPGFNTEALSAWQQRTHTVAMPHTQHNTAPLPPPYTLSVHWTAPPLRSCNSLTQAK